MAELNSPAYKLHMAAVERARAELDRQRAADEYAAHWERDHRCDVCATVAPDVGLRTAVTVQTGEAGTASIRVRVRACEPCTLTVAGMALDRHAAEKVGRRSSLDLARDWLDAS